MSSDQRTGPAVRLPPTGSLPATLVPYAETCDATALVALPHREPSRSPFPDLCRRSPVVLTIGPPAPSDGPMAFSGKALNWQKGAGFPYRHLPPLWHAACMRRKAATRIALYGAVREVSPI